MKVTVNSCHSLHHGEVVDVRAMAFSSLRTVSAGKQVNGVRIYRLVDQRCCPHPVLDDHFDSMDAAWDAAQEWWQQHSNGREDPIGIGVEVSTPGGDWRTLRYPGNHCSMTP